MTTKTQRDQPAVTTFEGLVDVPAGAGRPNTTRSREAGGDAVLLLGTDRSQIGVARSLGRAGYRVVVGRSQHSSFAELSRYTAEVWDHPPVAADPVGFVDAVADFLRARPDVGFLYPIGDLEVIRISRALDRLPPTVTAVMADRRIVETCHDKLGQMQLAQDLGVPVAPFAVVSSLKELGHASARIGFPCVVKPRNPMAQLFHRKALILGSRQELREALPAWPEDHEALLVQREVSGPRHNLYFAASEGELLAVVEIKILRNQTPDGTSNAVAGISLSVTPGLQANLQSLARALNFTGVGCAQFLVGGAEAPTTFLEINPRLGANFACVLHCGLDLPRIALELAAGRRPALAGRPWRYPAGRRYVWTFGDLQGLRDALRAREIGPLQAVRWLATCLLAALRADAHVTWSWRDPLPTLALFARPIANRLKGSPPQGPTGSDFRLSNPASARRY